MTPRDPHISDEQLAALVEGGLEWPEAESARSHLIGCRTCLAAYADTVHLRAQWQRVDATPPQVIDARARFRGNGRAWILAACLPLLIAAAAWFLASRPSVDPVDLHPAFDQVASAVAAASHTGMILPGCADAAWEPPELVFRSGGADPELAAALAELHDLPADDFPAETRALLVAGEIAAGNLQTADTLLDVETASTSDDPEILVLAGVLAYRESDLQTSRIFFERALEIDPDHPEARFDFALLLIVEGRVDEARNILVDLADREDLPLLHHRARAELGMLGS